MNRCLSCMSAIPEDKVCKHCGFDNKEAEPKKMRHLMPGTVLKNRFLIGLSTKSNNIFITYIAYDIEKKKRIYIDEFMPSSITKRALGKLKVNVREEYNAKFERAKRLVILETKALIELKSKNLDILGAFSGNNTFYIIREYIEDLTLTEYMKKNKNVSKKYADHILKSLIKILVPIHKMGIVCGSICPDNIVIDAIDSVKITNFGYGLLSEIIPVPVFEGYSPIEQYKNGICLNFKSDVYSAAATYYFVLTGQNPVSAKVRRKTDTLMPPSTMGIEIERHIENALLNALNINPKNRTTTLVSFNKELKDENTIRRWERVKAEPKRDFSFVVKKAFWRKILIYGVIIIMLLSLVGLVYDTVRVENKVRDESIKESEISTMAVPTVEHTTKVYEAKKDS
ncbi:MAG: protein kinase [Lachnospirales bacterium]